MEDELLGALVEAAVYNDINTVNMLLAEQPALINAAEEEDGATALMIACDEGHADMVNFLLQHGASVEKQNAIGNTAVHHACSHGHTDIVRVLADKGADLAFVNQLGKTPLICAAFRGHPEVVALLLEDADVARQINIAGKDGRTAFFLACINGHVDVARLLLRAGADHTIAEINGKTPLAAASNKGFRDCVTLIEDMERRLSLQKARSVHDLQELRLHSPGTPLPAYVQARADEGLDYPRLEIVDVLPKEEVQRVDAETKAYAVPQERAAVLQFVVRDLPRELFVELLRSI